MSTILRVRRVGWAFNLCRLGMFLALALGAAGLFKPASTQAAQLHCLADPGDASDIADLRRTIDTNCICANFAKHGDYVSCAKGFIDAAVHAATPTLRSKCKGLVKSFYSKSTCGYDPNLHKRVCIKTKMSDGSLSCGIKSTTKSDGVTATGKCMDKPGKYTQKECAAAFTQCIAAADTNGNQSIGAGDSGDCGCGPTQTDPQTDPSNCGRCGHLCTPPLSGTASCVLGECEGACPPGSEVCGPGADGGGFCTTGLCFGFFSDSCDVDPNSFSGIIRFTGEADATHITKIQAQCGTASRSAGTDGSGAAVLVPGALLPERGTGSGGSPWTANCPVDQVVVGFDGYGDTTPFVTQLTFRCAPIMIDGSLNVTLGAPTTLTPVGPGGGSSTPLPSFTCPVIAPDPGSIASNYNGVADGGLEILNLDCSSLSPNLGGGCQLDPRPAGPFGVVNLFVIAGVLFGWKFAPRLRRR